MKFRHFPILFYIILLLISCDTFNENMVLAYFDSNEKTITVSSGADPLIFGMKEILLDNEWGVKTYSNSFDTEDLSFSSIDTRYLMISDYDQGDDLIMGDFVRDYSFTIYDAENESEVIILYGKQRTVEQVLDEFKTLIKSNETE